MIVILALMGALVCGSLVVCDGVLDASCWFIVRVMRVCECVCVCGIQ